ncbi:fluconazole resistance protein 1 [Diaporthe helianthi]|uniref:Fluconazole resistance protein 1 n=1 Tax=Diaporthe helianthi TaxID=158607 RepID=A0A2P5I294_DIAHE|nr:fluconazole resistance protein 1 [Diaporthe helianthi]
MTNSLSSTSLESSVTATEADVQSQSPGMTRVSHFKIVFDRAGVTKEALQWRYLGNGTEESPYAVDFTPCDPYNPQEWTRTKKWCMTILTAISTLAVAFVSSAFSGGLATIIAEFKVSQELSILGLSLFVVGFAVGPLLWAPASEFYGRQILFTVTYAALTAFNAGAAGVQSFAGLVVLRFFAGAFGSSPLTNSGGVIADMFSQSERGFATAVFAAAPFLGPSLGPIVSGFLGEAEGWRWIEGLMAIFTGVLWIVNSLLVPETYAPVLLRIRAAKLSKLTGKVYVSKMDINKKQHTMAQQFKVALSRPWLLLFREPIVFLTSVYMAIVYGTLYMMFPAFPIVFQVSKGWSPGEAGLAFLGITVGMVFAVAYAMFDNKRYARVSEEHGGMAPPEARLPMAIVGSAFIPVGLFWFAWTNGDNVHWVVPIIGSAFFAVGIVLVFLSLMNYLIDSYVVFAASVLAANSVLRSLFGAAFPLFTGKMYTNLGLHWAASVPAFLSVACIPFPIIFYIYGPRIRARCKFAAEAARVLEEMRGGGGNNTEDPEAAEDEAMEEVERGDRMEKLVKKMSRASGKSRTRRLSRVESGAAGPASEAVPKEVNHEKVDV